MPVLPGFRWKTLLAAAGLLSLFQASGGAVAAEDARAVQDAVRGLQDLVAAGSYEHAYAFAQILVHEYPNEPGIHLGYARLLRSTGQPDKAMAEYFRTNQLAPKLTEPLVALSQISLDNLDVENGLRYAKQALAIDPSSEQARAALVSALLQSDKTNEAQNELTKMLRNGQKNPSALHLAAQLASKKGDFKQAKQYLQQAVALQPERTDWTLELCKVLENSGDPTVARMYLERVVARKPYSVEPQLQLARNVEAYGHDYERAISLYQRVILLEPTNPQAIAGLDRCNAKRNNLALQIKQALHSLFNGGK